MPINVRKIAPIGVGAVTGAGIGILKKRIERKNLDLRMRKLRKKEKEKTLNDVEKAELDFLKKQKEYIKKNPAIPAIDMTSGALKDALAGALIFRSADKMHDVLQKANLLGKQVAKTEFYSFFAPFKRMNMQQAVRHPAFTKVLSNYVNFVDKVVKHRRKMPLIIGANAAGIGALGSLLGSNLYSPVKKEKMNKKVLELTSKLPLNQDQKKLLDKRIKLHDEKIKQLLNNPDMIKKEKRKHKIKNVFKGALLAGVPTAFIARSLIEGNTNTHLEAAKRLKRLMQHLSSV